MCFLVALMPFMALAQTKNTVSEVRDYREIDGKIIISCLVNGEEADFVLDLAGQSAILPEYAEKLRIFREERQKLSVEYSSCNAWKNPVECLSYIRKP